MCSKKNTFVSSVSWFGWTEFRLGLFDITGMPEVVVVEGDGIDEPDSIITGRRNLFRSVSLPEPSILTRYCLFGRTSTTRPVLYHVPLPWTLTAVFTSSGLTSWALLLYLVWRESLRCANAFSLS